MAKQAGHIRVRGVDNDTTFYMKDGVYYARMKSSLTGRKFWRHKAFEGSRRSSKRFGDGNNLASRVYRSLPKEKRVYALFCQLKSAAIVYLKQGLSPKEVSALLLQLANQERFVMPSKKKQTKPKKAFPYATVITSEYIGLTMGRLAYLQKKYGDEKLEEMVESFFNAVQFYQPPPLRLAATA